LFYVHGWIPLNKDPEAVDCKLIEKCAIDASKRERARREKAGLANYARRVPSAPGLRRASLRPPLVVDPQCVGLT
jgi:hypothetical protein